MDHNGISLVYPDLEKRVIFRSFHNYVFYNGKLFIPGLTLDSFWILLMPSMLLLHTIALNRS